MPCVDPIRIVLFSSGSYEVAAADVDGDDNRDAPADRGFCCDGHCTLTNLPSILRSADVVPHVYPEAEDDEFVGDLPLPGEKDALYAVLTALEMKFDLDC